MMAAGFISFPLLTRIFSVSDYGLLGLITTTLLIATAITKLGLPESIVRFYAESKSTNRLKEFYSTLLLTSMAASAIIAILFGLATQFMHNILDRNIINLLPLLSVLIFTGCTTTTLTSFFKSGAKNKALECHRNNISIWSAFTEYLIGLILYEKLIWFLYRTNYIRDCDAFLPAIYVPQKIQNES